MIPETFAPIQTDLAIHDWLRQVHVAFVPARTSSLLEETVAGMRHHFNRLGHIVQETPNDQTDVVLTTAMLGDLVHWRRAMIFTARQRYKISHTPTFVTVVHAQPQQWQALLDHFSRAINKDVADPADYDFPGLSPQAHVVLHEQGRRGGPILAAERLIQAQIKSIRVLLVVGDDRPQIAYHFDLVGAHPVSDASDQERFYDDIVLRLVTSLCAQEVNHHETVGDPIDRQMWDALETPAAMCNAAQEFGRRNFFTDTVHIANLVQVPSVAGSVASQYSEGCFATWDPEISALIATVTGSARPVHKKAITEDDLSVIVGVRPDRMGALVRAVEGKQNDPPSTEAVELYDVDDGLPRVYPGREQGWQGELPVIRSKLHGHRGIRVYDPHTVEYVPMAAPYFNYLVTCGTGAQAAGVKDAFSRSQALRDPADPRQIAFTILPGHGLILVEKWVPGKEPFQILWEAMDAGQVEVDSYVPQGPMAYVPDETGMMVLP